MIGLMTSHTHGKSIWQLDRSFICGIPPLAVHSGQLACESMSSTVASGVTSVGPCWPQDLNSSPVALENRIPSGYVKIAIENGHL